MHAKLLAAPAALALLGGSLVGLPVLAAGGAPPTAAVPSARAVADIPADLLPVYQSAAARCPGLPWTVLAAVGKVETDHGRHGGAVLDAGTGVVAPPIVGPTLDGHGGTAAIRDTDGGAWDGDTVWDHAVGPMQFVPATWRAWRVEGSGDGGRDPHNAYDAIPTAADYLCGGAAELVDVRAALLRYNNSSAYVDEVLAVAAAYDSSGVGGPISCGPHTVDAPAPSALVLAVIADACSQLGDPYQWGAGRVDDPDPPAFDCSGLTWWAFNQNGVVLAFTADTQFDDPDAVAVPAGPGQLGALLPGDLVFFTYGRLPPGNADHVAIYLGGGAVVEALNTDTPVAIRDISSDGSVIGATRPGTTS
jgi:cell wall-associated NlpC family hydrolase